ncbi:MAG: hypothetical protein R2713_09510 [Ilumatobacteraceae bacterium]
MIQTTTTTDHLPGGVDPAVRLASQTSRRRLRPVLLVDPATPTPRVPGQHDLQPVELTPNPTTAACRPPSSSTPRSAPANASITS